MLKAVRNQILMEAQVSFRQKNYFSKTQGNCTKNHLLEKCVFFFYFFEGQKKSAAFFEL